MKAFLTLDDIPPETFEPRVRSALAWVIDQYQVSTDQRNGIANDPNRPDDPETIVRLLGQVITVTGECQVHAAWSNSIKHICGHLSGASLGARNFLSASVEGKDKRKSGRELRRA